MCYLRDVSADLFLAIIAAPAPKPRAPQAVYRFHEGFSNAVRVTKKISDFL